MNTALAAKLGITPDQLAGVLAFEATAPKVEVTETGTVTTDPLYSADRIAQRRAELARERDGAASTMTITQTADTATHKFTAWFICSTLVASRLPITLSHVECTCGWSHESYDVTDGGQQIDKHWRRRNWNCRSCADAA